MLKYRARIVRRDGHDFVDVIGPVPRVGDKVFLSDVLYVVTEVIWTPNSVDDAVAEVAVIR